MSILHGVLDDPASFPGSGGIEGVGFARGHGGGARVSLAGFGAVDGNGLDSLFSKMPDHFFTRDDPEPGFETAAPLEAAKQVEFPFDQAQEDFSEDVLGVLGRVGVAADAKALADD